MHCLLSNSPTMIPIPTPSLFEPWMIQWYPNQQLVLLAPSNSFLEPLCLCSCQLHLEIRGSTKYDECFSSLRRIWKQCSGKSMWTLFAFDIFFGALVSSDYTILILLDFVCFFLFDCRLVEFSSEMPCCSSCICFPFSHWNQGSAGMLECSPLSVSKLNWARKCSINVLSNLDWSLELIRVIVSVIRLRMLSKFLALWGEGERECSLVTKATASPKLDARGSLISSLAPSSEVVIEPSPTEHLGSCQRLSNLPI